MAVKVPIRTVFDGSTATGLAEYQSGEFIGLTHGGIGASLSIGSVGQVLKVNSGGSALEFGTATVAAAQTGITSILATDLIIGEDTQTAIDFGTANEIDFKVDNAARLTLTSSVLFPVTDNQIDLGTSSLEFKDAFFDGTVTSDAFAGPLTGNVTGNADTATVATTVTITDNESTNENNAIIFTAGGDLDGGNLGLESDGDLKYNPSTGTLSATNISVSGTFSTVNSVTMDANNAVIFEGSTADAHETTLTSVDATADRTISLPNVTGTIITTANSDSATTTTDDAAADFVLVDDGGVLKKITPANLGIGGTAGSVAADDIGTGDSAIALNTSAGNITIDARGSNTDIIFKGTDGSTDITPMTLDMSAAGALFLTGGKIDLKNAGTASQILFYCESSNAHFQTLIAAPHSQAADNTLTLPDGNDGVILSTVSTATVTNKTLTAPVINTATVGTSITPASDDGATLGSANLNWSDLFLADAGVINLGDDQDVKITHVADTGLLLNAAMVVQFRDSAINIGSPADGDLDINADDEIELNSTLIDINGNVEISGTAAITGIATFTDDIVIGDGKTIGSASAATAMTISSGGIVTFVDDILIKDGGTIGVASSTSAITIASTGIVTFVDDIVLKDAATIGVASSTSAITIASTGIVTFVDDILLKDACTIGTATTAGAIAIAADGTVDLATAGATVNSVVIKTVGKESIWVPAASMTPTTSNPCSDITIVETTSGRPDMVVLDFATGADEFAQFSIAFPKSWNLGTITYQAFWSGIAASTDCDWSLQGVAMNDNQTIDVAYGTAVVVSDNAQGAVEELYVAAESGAVTIAGTPADNDLCYFRIGRDVSGDNMNGDARLHGLKIFFTTDSPNDA